MAISRAWDSWTITRTTGHAECSAFIRLSPSSISSTRSSSDILVRSSPLKGSCDTTEDVAQIITAGPALPPLPDSERRRVIAECLGGRKVDSRSAALVLDDRERRDALEEAYAAIAPMYWGDRITLADCCDTIRRWLASYPLARA